MKAETVAKHGRIRFMSVKVIGSNIGSTLRHN